MMKIFKYSVAAGPFSRRMPKGARFLCVAVQHEVPQMWFEVNPDTEDEDRCFEVFGTGHDAAGRYLGTFQLLGGDFIGHLYEVA